MLRSALSPKRKFFSSESVKIQPQISLRFPTCSNEGRAQTSRSTPHQQPGAEIRRAYQRYLSGSLVWTVEKYCADSPKLLSRTPRCPGRRTNSRLLCSSGQWSLSDATWGDLGIQYAGGNGQGSFIGLWRMVFLISGFLISGFLISGFLISGFLILGRSLGN